VPRRTRARAGILEDPELLRRYLQAMRLDIGDGVTHDANFQFLK
jgi:hypothetical protein